MGVISGLAATAIAIVAGVGGGVVGYFIRGWMIRRDLNRSPPLRDSVERVRAALWKELAEAAEGPRYCPICPALCAELARLRARNGQLEDEREG